MLMRGADTTRFPFPSTFVLKSPNPCWRFHQGHYCPEELCHYQHAPRLVLDRRTSRRSPASHGSTACIFFARGFCKNGTTCKFAHAYPPSSSAAQASSSAGSLKTTHCSNTQGSETVGRQDSSPVVLNSRGSSFPFQAASPPQSTTCDPQSIVGQSEASTLGKQATEVDVASDSTGTVTPFTLHKDSPSPPSSPQNQGAAPVHPPVSSNEIPSMIVEGLASIWDEVEGLDEEEFVSRHAPYIDTNHHAPQVYDDKTVCVLSGGVMLGMPGPSGSRPPAPPVVSG